MMKTVYLLGFLIFICASSAGALPLLTLSLPESPERRVRPAPTLLPPGPEALASANVLGPDSDVVVVSASLRLGEHPSPSGR